MIYILDTNVISDALAQEAKVLAWLEKQPENLLYTTTVTAAELFFGVERLPHGKRQTALSREIETALLLFGDRILPFDAKAAFSFGQLAAAAESRGKTLATADGFIAAIADARAATVVSRDEQPFQAAGVPLINPWTL